jgi:hypothetical protein
MVWAAALSWLLVLSGCHDKPTQPPPPPPPESTSTGLVFNISGNVAYFNPVNDSVVGHGVLTNRVIVAGQTFHGSDVMAFADAHAWSIGVLQFFDLAVQSEAVLGGVPLDVAATPDLSKIYSITGNGNFYRFTPSDGDLDTVEVKLHPRRIALRPPNLERAWVVCQDSMFLHIIDAVEMAELDTLRFREPPSAIAFSTNGHNAYISFRGYPGHLVTYDADSLIPIGDFEIGPGPCELTVSSNDRYLAIADSTTGVLTLKDLVERTMWSLETGATISRVRFSPEVDCCFVLVTGRSEVLKIRLDDESPVVTDTLRFTPSSCEMIFWEDVH